MRLEMFLENLWKKIYPKRILAIIVLTSVLTIVSTFIAFTIASNARFAAPVWSNFIFIASLTLFAKVLFFFLAQLHRSSWRYTSVSDALNLFKVITVAHTLVFLVVIFAIKPPPFSALVADYFFSLLVLPGIRLLVRAVFEKTRSRLPKEGQSEAIRVLIVGAGEAGTTLLRKLKFQKRIRVVGFVDDSWQKLGMQFYGIRVLGNVDNLPRLVAAHDIHEIYIAIPSLNKKGLQRVTQACIRSKLTFRTIPSTKEMLELKTGIDQLREVRVEDLLGREPIALNKVATFKEIENQVVLVTGAGGSIGSELCRQILSFKPSKLILFERCEYNLFQIERELSKRAPANVLVPVIGDIHDEFCLETVFRKHKPMIVYHAAAYKHVPLMEISPREAIRNNVFGTRNLADIAVKFNVSKFVMISTDKAVRPLSVMGYSKRLAELVVQSRANSGTRFISVRFGNVLGSSGSVVEIFRKQIKDGGPLTVTHAEARRFFMTTPEAVELVLHAGTHGKNGEIYMLKMGEPCRIMNLAKKMIELSDPEGKRGLQIQITGLRPGEKLTEELVWEGEDFVPSNIESIYALRNKVITAGLSDKLFRLESLMNNTYCDFESELKSLVAQIDCDENMVESHPDSLIVLPFSQAQVVAGSAV